MQKEFSDQQLDQLMRSLVNQASLDENAVAEIAESPTLWWGVQRHIKGGDESTSSPWPPSVAIRRWLTIVVPSMAAAALVLAFFMMRTPVVPVERVLAPTMTSDAETTATPVSPASVVTDSKTVTALAVPSKQSGTQKASTTQTKPKAVARTATPVVAKASTEVKTDYIALTYAGNPDSGQVVRVKVPSSMMVSLGLVSSVEKPTRLVDAEVVVGDDGQTHAIRFIR